jgi:hypothetical protein
MRVSYPGFDFKEKEKKENANGNGLIQTNTDRIKKTS